MDVVILSRTINVDHKDFGKLTLIKPLGNMSILSKCVRNFLSVYNAYSLKIQGKMKSYTKGKILAHKPVLMIHMTIKFRAQLELSEHIFVMLIGLALHDMFEVRLSIMYLVLLRNGNFGCNADQEHT